VRPEFFCRRQAGAPDGRTRVLVFGGSQGAHAINVAMAEARGAGAARLPST
jgi:UDP-N-acetylglucosamine:LPS N-acetylglucosamine transferase